MTKLRRNSSKIVGKNVKINHPIHFFALRSGHRKLRQKSLYPSESRSQKFVKNFPNENSSVSRLVRNDCVDIFPSQCGSQFLLTECKSVKTSAWIFFGKLVSPSKMSAINCDRSITTSASTNEKFDGPYSVTMSIRRPNFRCKCYKILSKIPSKRG